MADGKSKAAPAITGASVKVPVTNAVPSALEQKAIDKATIASLEGDEDDGEGSDGGWTTDTTSTLATSGVVVEEEDEDGEEEEENTSTPTSDDEEEVKVKIQPAVGDKRARPEPPLVVSEIAPFYTEAEVVTMEQQAGTDVENRSSENTDSGGKSGLLMNRKRFRLLGP